MTHSEKLQAMIKEGKEMTLSSQQEMIVLLMSIASSLAAIADCLEEENNGV